MIIFLGVNESEMKERKPIIISLICIKTDKYKVWSGGLEFQILRGGEGVLRSIIGQTIKM